MRRAGAALFQALLLLSIAAHADGPVGYRPRESNFGTPQPGAIDAYNEGYALILRAEHQENLALASSDAGERRTAQRAAADAYSASLSKFTLATQLDRSLHEAFTYIGYANRKIGRYQESLDAYARALKINPDYPPAIEYQGEAYLGLNQPDAARFNYLRLYALSPKLASKLFLAMQQWLADHRADPPKGVDMQAFADWMAERASSIEAQAAKTASSGSW